MRIETMAPATPDRQRFWSCRGRRLPLARPLLMGIINATPDSFSDGGVHFDCDRAVEQGLKLVAEGADILDIGGESARPGAAPVAASEELRRVLPVIRRLAAGCALPLSIDTRHAAVAHAALECGAAIINNIMPLAGSPELVELARTTGAGLVAMHMRGTPQNMTRFAIYDDVVTSVETELRQALEYAQERGLAPAQLMLDPGIGFAKDTRQNLALLNALERLARLGPLLVGVSRKRFIGDICQQPDPMKRLGGSVAAALWCALHGAAVLRVHDVAATRQALTTVAAIKEAR